MDQNAPWIEALPSGELQELAEVPIRAVHASIGNEPQEVQLPTLANDTLHQGAKGAIGRELTVTDGLVNAGDIHVHRTARAQIQMAHLAVAHQAQGQTHLVTRGRE